MSIQYQLMRNRWVGFGGGTSLVAFRSLNYSQIQIMSSFIGTINEFTHGQMLCNDHLESIQDRGWLEVFRSFFFDNCCISQKSWKIYSALRLSTRIEIKDKLTRIFLCAWKSQLYSWGGLRIRGSVFFQHSMNHRLMKLLIDLTFRSNKSWN